MPPRAAPPAPYSAALGHRDVSRLITPEVQDRFRPLGVFLAERFAELAADGRAVNQSALARLMGFKDRRQITKYIETPWRLRNLKGWQVAVYFGPSGLDLKPSKTQGIVSEYDLNPPPSLGETSVRAVDIYVESGATVTHMEPVPVSYLGGHDPNHVRLRYIESSDLVTAGVRQRVQVGHRLLLALAAEPRAGDLVVVEQNDREALALWPLKDAEHATPLDPEASVDALLLKSQYARVTRVMLDYGTGRWGKE